jgi:hypothetical protein
MICRIGDVVRRGRLITVEQSVDPAAVVAAIRDADSGSEEPIAETAGDPERRIAVTAAPPQAVHEHVGYLRRDMGLQIRTALARAARSRGLTTPYDEDIQETRDALDSVTGESDPVEPYRRKLAATKAETAQLRERVAAARGRLQAKRDDDCDTEAAVADLEAAIRRLSEVETSVVATRQQLDRARTNARERRDRRERKRKLEDRVANLERDARSHLVERLREEYETALSRIPEHTDIASVPGDPFAAAPLPAALAIARVADLSAPLVLACDCFTSPDEASKWLDTPIVQI